MDDAHFGMVLGDGVRDLLEQDRLARARRRDDEPALTLPDRRHDVDHAHAQVAVFRLEAQARVRIARAQRVERNARLREIRLEPVHARHAQEREILLPRLGRANLPLDLVARAQVEALDLRRRHVHVVRTGEIAPVLAPEKAVPFRKDLEHARGAERHAGVEQALPDAQDQLGFGELLGVLHLQAVGHALELRERLPLEFSDFHA
jgi:hypothetical protein